VTATAGDWSVLLPRCARCREPALALWLIHGTAYCRPCTRLIVQEEQWAISYRWK